ncbi:MAG: hypothetical protein PHT69_08580 [Bacteroidales bacterium]|nr:hypothetical protein [Bacteroidales bacterium]
MIKISHIEPLEGNLGKVPIRKIRNDFFARLNNNENRKIIKIFKVALKKKKLYGFNLNRKPEHRSFIKFIIKNYKKILIGNLDLLEKIKKEIKNNGWQNLIFINDSTTHFGDEVLKAFGYTKYFRSEQDRGIWLAKQLNIKACPYCNAQYTLYVDVNDTEGLANFQFDHFFPKDRYPYFSVSLYNLIPSCANCNHSKSNNDVTLKNNYHPYYNSMALVSEFYVKYPDEVEKLSLKSIQAMNYDNEIEVSFRSKYSETTDFVNTHNNDFHIESIYKRHKDIAHEILVKSILNNRYYQKSILKIEGLFPDKHTMLKYILGNYMREDEILKRPLAKFTQDIARQLSLLK